MIFLIIIALVVKDVIHEQIHDAVIGNASKCLDRVFLQGGTLHLQTGVLGVDCIIRVVRANIPEHLPEVSGQLTQRRVVIHPVHHGGIVKTHGIVNFLCGGLCLACVFRSILVRIVGLRGHNQTGKRIDNVIAVRTRGSRRNIAEAIINHGMPALTPSKPGSLIAERPGIRIGHPRKRVIKPGDNLACNKDCLRCSNFALLGFDRTKNLIATRKYLFKQRGSIELEQAFRVSKFGGCRRQCRTD